MLADPAAYALARDLLSRWGRWLPWLAAAAAWAAVLLSFRSPTPPRRLARPGAWSAVCFAVTAAGFIALAVYHGIIYRSLPLELPARAGEWVNARLLDMAARGRGGLDIVDWSNPPRFAIPLWIEGEKLFFWTLALALVVLMEEKRRHGRYSLVLRAILALQLTGCAAWSNPFWPPLPQFDAEIAAWLGGSMPERAGLFFNIYPRMKYYYNASYMWIHPPMLFIAYATLTATFASSLISLKRDEPALDRAGYTWAKLGYILLTVGMLVGYPWAIVAWGPNWWWDPKIAASIMMWLLYSAYLHHRFISSYKHGRVQLAVIGILCYLSLLFTYFMSWFFPGQHTF